MACHYAGVFGVMQMYKVINVNRCAAHNEHVGTERNVFKSKICGREIFEARLAGWKLFCTNSEYKL